MDVFGIDSSGEMVVNRPLGVDKLLLDAKQIEYKIFDVSNVEGITTEFVIDIASNSFDLIKLGKVLGNVDFFSGHFVLQQVHFVEEKYDGDL